MKDILDDPTNEALLFISKRIADPNYRGEISSQHNRFDLEKVKIILKLVNKHAPNKKLMRIRTKDISARPESHPEEELYSKFCNKVKEEINIGSEDAMRKNLFPDFHRMGLIIRYDKNKEPTDPYEKQSIRYISLSNLGEKLIKGEGVDSFYIFSKGLNNLFNGKIELLLNLMRNDEYELEHITKDEYMFFVSAINIKEDFSITEKRAIEVISKWRLLPRIKRGAVIDSLKKRLVPTLTHGSKTEKRDYHNWRNKIDQIYSLLKETIYFEVEGEKLKLKQLGKGIQRSNTEKKNYFTNHAVKKRNGFELHHIIPLADSETEYHFKILDSWKNMIYIDGYSHAQITQSNNTKIILEAKQSDLLLKDYSDNTMELVYNKNVIYNIAKQNIMLKYNKEYLEGRDEYVQDDSL